MEDKLKENRKKVKYILELRYPPLVNIFDRRGEILDKIHPLFKKKMEHWKVENSQVVIADSLTVASNQIAINHLRSSITYEDPKNLKEYLDDTHKFLETLKELFPELNNLTRMGFRVITIVNSKELGNYNSVIKLFKNNILKSPFPSKLQFDDLRITLTGEQYSVNVGPVKKDEEWINSAFSDSLSNIPDFGIALDVDTYTKDISCSDKKDIIDSFDKICALSNEIEFDITNGIISS